MLCGTDMNSEIGVSMDFEQTCSGNEVVVAHSTSHKSIRDRITP